MSCIDNPETMGNGTPTLKISRSSEEGHEDAISCESSGSDSLIIDTRTVKAP